MKLPAALPDEEFFRRVRRLIAQIRRDFANVSLKGGVGIYEAWEREYRNGRFEEARKLDSYTTWIHLDLDQLDPNSTCLSFFDGIGWVFHIPAYMTRALNWMLENDMNAYELVYTLGSDRTLISESRARMTQAQRRCCARHLVLAGEMDARYEYDTFNAIGALREYWWDDLDAAEQKQIAERWKVDA